MALMNQIRPPKASSPTNGTAASTPRLDLRRATAWLCRYVPALDSLRTYSPAACSSDVMAGVTVAAIAVPQAMAYAILAGLPPQYGLYTAIVVTAVGALFDSSYQLINGPTNAISIALLSALAVIPEESRIPAAIFFAFLVGVCQLGITLLRLGDLSRFVSHAVIVGFTLGAGVLLVLDQFKNLVGLSAQGGPEDHFLTRFWLSITTGGPCHGPTILISVGTIALILMVRQINGSLRLRGMRFPVPQHLVAVIMMSLLVWAFDLEQSGVKVVGNIPGSLPGFRLPEWRWDWGQLLAGKAFAVAILGLLEAIAMSKAIASQTGQKLNIRQQCLSEGMANLVGSFFQCMPGSGSLTRSTVNRQAGAVSQWSGVVAAVTVAATMLLFAPFAGHIPRASLAGLLILAAFRMVDYKQLWFHLRATRFDALIVVATALAAVFVSVEFCILIGVFLSFALYVPRAAQVKLTELALGQRGELKERGPDDPTREHMLLFHLEGELSFGAAPDFERHLDSIKCLVRKETHVVVLFLKQARNPDAAFLALLADFHRDLNNRGVVLILCGVRQDLVRGLQGTGLDAQIGPEYVFAETGYPDNSTHDGVLRAIAIVSQMPLGGRRRICHA